jgi:hypothetical protein
VEKLLKKIDSKYPPQFVQIVPEEFSEFESCFFNVQEKKLRDEGEIIYGWKLHKSLILIEAERHSVWKSPKGELIDVTPDRTGINKSLFIQDDKAWEYSGEYTDNIRINITKNVLVDDYILLSETISKLYQTTKRKSKTEILIWEPIAKMIKFLGEDKRLREVFIYSNNNLENNCYCGSFQKYKECHGFNLNEGYVELINHAQCIVKNNTIL